MQNEDDFMPRNAISVNSIIYQFFYFISKAISTKTKSRDYKSKVRRSCTVIKF